jgi:hypothetical protein
LPSSWTSFSTSGERGAVPATCTVTHATQRTQPFAALHVSHSCLSCSTAYENDDGHIVTQRCLIAKHYLRGWFIIDLVAVLPYSYIVMMLGNDVESKGSSQGIIKSLRLVRLAKLLRLTRLLPLLRRLDERFDGLLSASKLISLVTVVIYVTHIVGCLWFTVGEDDDYLASCVDENTGAVITEGRDHSSCLRRGWVNSQLWGPSVPVGDT